MFSIFGLIIDCQWSFTFLILSTLLLADSLVLFLDCQKLYRIHSLRLDSHEKKCGRNRKWDLGSSFSWHGFSGNNGMGLLFFKNFQMIFFFDDLSFSWPFHPLSYPPKDGKQDIFTKPLFLQKSPCSFCG